MSELGTEEIKTEEAVTEAAKDEAAVKEEPKKQAKKKASKEADKVAKPVKPAKPATDRDVKKMFIISMAVSTVVIIILLGVILYLLRDSLPFIGKGDTTAESEAEVTEYVQEPEEEEAGAEEIKTDTADEPADPEEIDIEAMSEAAEDTTVRPDEWYGSFESSGTVEENVPLEQYREVCPDIYAWIEIPGTDISEPVAYCEDATDPFWFTHNMEGKPSDKGMVITDSMNGKDFSDPVTLIYGHSPDDGTVFAQLHEFKDADFFDKNDTINIYTDDAELVYRIYACYTGSSDHILVGNDFNDPKGFEEYFDSIKDIRDLSLNIRQDAKPMFNDHVITLVTHCDDDSKRLFVHAVLEKVRY